MTQVEPGIFASYHIELDRLQSKPDPDIIREARQNRKVHICGKEVGDLAFGEIAMTKNTLIEHLKDRHPDVEFSVKPVYLGYDIDTDELIMGFDIWHGDGFGGGSIVLDSDTGRFARLLSDATDHDTFYTGGPLGPNPLFGTLHCLEKQRPNLVHIHTS